METECYPCIPMHSASNQKRMNHSTITMIKTEPLSEDVNVVVDDHENSNNDLKSAGSSSLSHSLSRQQNLQKQAANTRKRSVQNQNQQLQQTQQNTTTTTTTAPSRVQQHTIRLSRVSQDILLFMHTCKLGKVRLSKLHKYYSSI